MAVKTMDIYFENGFNGRFNTENAEVLVGVKENQVLPYDMLYGALASCLYATFLEIVEKKKITYKGCTIRVSGEKREEVPTTLKWVKVTFIIDELQNGTEKGVKKSVELAAKYCSIYQTIAHVADMSYELLINE